MYYLCYHLSWFTVITILYLLLNYIQPITLGMCNLLSYFVFIYLVYFINCIILNITDFSHIQPYRIQTLNKLLLSRQEISGHPSTTSTLQLFENRELVFQLAFKSFSLQDLLFIIIRCWEAQPSIPTTMLATCGGLATHRKGNTC